ncbi:MAG: flagellar motor switch protein FliG [Zetaproteobacteria bacterium]|nr:MAG: flagellar motor switch protein FliG [Zetaproteobacteria bacterium]
MARGGKDFSELTGDDKVALLLFALGPEAAAPVIRQMDDETLMRIGRRMSEMGKIPTDVLNKVLEEYLALHQSNDPLLRSTKKDVMALFQRAIDEDRAKRLIQEMDKPRTLTIWDKLSRMNPRMITSFIENEHPQTIALILGNIDTAVASQVISMLPDDIQMSVVLRMSKIESVSQELVRDIEETLEKVMSESTGQSGMSFDGMVNVVQILKTLDKSVSKPILQKLEEKDPELFSQVDKMLLVFEDLKMLSDRDIQTLLKHVSSDDLVRALKGSSEEVAERFFSNMSQRAADIMREDMQVMPPLKLADVEESQMNILRVARKLDDDGAITLGGAEDLV